MRQYKIEFHEFKEPYIDANGESWHCYCKGNIDYKMVRDSIDYPNGLVRHIIEPKIEGFDLFDFEVFKNSDNYLEGEDVPDEMIKFFTEIFDPSQYSDGLE